MLYNECKRLKKFVNLLTHRDSDGEITSELDAQINDHINQESIQPSLSSKLHSKKSTIENLLLENERISKMLEDTRIENESLRERVNGDTGKKKTTIISPDNIKNKKGLKKGESKIIRQKTGYNSKAQQIMNETKKIDEEIARVKQEIAKISDDKVEHDFSKDSFIHHRQDHDYGSKGGDDSKNAYTEGVNEIPIIKNSEVSEYFAELRQCMQVFEDRACKFLFKDKYLISVNLAKEAFQTKLLLSPEAAHKLSRFLIEPNDKEFLLNKSYTSNSRDVMSRIEEALGKYRRYDRDDTEKLIQSFFLPENSKLFNRFISELEDLSHVKFLSKSEVERTISNLGMDINMKTLMIQLMRDSNSLQNITGDALRAMIELIRREENARSPNSKSKTNNTTAFLQISENKKQSMDAKTAQKGDKGDAEVSKSNSIFKKDTEYRPTQDDLKLNHGFFVRLAEFMFYNDLTLYQIIHSKIYDKMFNGREYELINSHSK